MRRMIKVYGIPNCDSVKKARAWLQAQGHAVAFHDFKKLGVPSDELTQWVERLGWEVVLNRKGTTWRLLDETIRSGVTDAASALAVMRHHPSTIKRPVVSWPQGLTVGFVPERWTDLPKA